MKSKKRGHGSANKKVLTEIMISRGEAGNDGSTPRKRRRGDSCSRNPLKELGNIMEKGSL